MNKPVEVTEYILPNGRRRSATVMLPSDAWDKAQALLNAGYVFEYEWLRTGDLSCTVADKALEADVGISVKRYDSMRIGAGERIHKAFEDLIEETYLAWAGHMTHAGTEWPSVK